MTHAFDQANPLQIDYYPQLLSLELTSRCNLRCTMCAISHHAELQPGGDLYGDLSDQSLYRIIAVLPNIGTVSLSGHGESTISKNLIPCIRMARESGCRIELTTNLAVLPDRLAEAMVQYRLDCLRVSFHAATPELYNRILRHGDYEHAVANLRKLNQLKRHAKSAFPQMRFHFVGMKQNIHELPALIRIASAMGVRRIQMLSLMEYPSVSGESLERYPELLNRWIPKSLILGLFHGVSLEVPPSYAKHVWMAQAARSTFLAARSLFYRVRSLARLKNGKNSKPTLPIETAQSDSTNERSRPAGNSLPPPQQLQSSVIRDCHDLWKNAYVQEDGSVRPCCVMNRRMGNLESQQFQEIWQGRMYENLRAEFLSDSPPRECRDCSIKGWTSRMNWMHRLRFLKHVGKPL